MMQGLLRTDGGCRPTNPGHAGFAAVLFVDERKYIVSNYIGRFYSNNYAEYCGVLVGIKMAIDVGVEVLDIIVDSQLIMNQINGTWKIKDHTLRVLHVDIKRLLAKHYEDSGTGETRWQIRWQKRDNNKEADMHCTQAIIWGQNQNKFTPSSIKAKRGNGAIHSPYLTISPSARNGKVR